ncbi:hypothetical protein CGZ65_03875 [Neisseria weixii]|nr:hypothetical protein CGZ65_03875 [Neisseria weixii]
MKERSPSRIFCSPDEINVTVVYSEITSILTGGSAVCNMIPLKGCKTRLIKGLNMPDDGFSSGGIHNKIL